MFSILGDTFSHSWEKSVFESEKKEARTICYIFLTFSWRINANVNHINGSSSSIFAVNIHSHLFSANDNKCKPGLFRKFGSTENVFGTQLRIPRMYEYIDPHISCSPIHGQHSRLFSKNKRMCGSVSSITTRQLEKSRRKSLRNFWRTFCIFFKEFFS